MYTPAREDGLATIVDMIEYVIVAFNDGNVDLAAVGLTDDMFKSDEGALLMDMAMRVIKSRTVQLVGL